ncbi:MAG: BamA/TamA family outer membrane protein [Elusimicrobia bacterium]|nr:BamA/TamA family outer membrane protein [Elusimicrobiota bacterium]
MNRLLFFPAVLAAAILPAAAEQSTVGGLLINGSTTKPEIIGRLLDTKPGASFTPALWSEDLRRLANSGYFYDVQGGSRAAGPGQIHLDLNLKNKFSTIPIFKFKQGGGTSQLTVGLYEVNAFHRLLEIGGQYERMNAKDGGVVWFRHPYFGLRKNRLGAELYAHTLNLPLLSKKGEPQAHFDNEEIRGHLWLEREISPRFKTALTLNCYRNGFEADDSTAEQAARNGAFLQNNRLNSGRTASLTPGAIWGRLDQDDHLVEGRRLKIQAELADRALGSQFEFVKLEAEAAAALVAGERWNLAGQARMGTKSGHEFQHKFYLGGLDTVRGFLDGQFRGEHMWLVNLEARPTILERPLWTLQGNLFADASKTWDARGFGAEGFRNPFLSFGAGLRLIVPRIYRAIIRLDAARTQEPLRQWGLSFGLQQFF